MISLPSFSCRHGWPPALAAACILCGPAMAQDYSLQVADSDPLGLGRFVPTSSELLQSAGGLESGLKGAFGFGASLATIYNSNFFLSENNREDEVSVLFQPYVNYTSDPEGGAIYSVSARYAPAFRAFLDNSDLNDINHSGDIVFNIVGSRTAASLFARYDEFSGSDRLTGTFNTGWVFTGGVRASREIASRTSINGGLSYSESDFSSGNSTGATIYTGHLGALWRATERTSLGATLRYTRSESGLSGTGTRDAWALLPEARYRAGERIWLSATLGPEFATDSLSDDNSVNLSANLQARYLINERWSWLNSLRTATVPSPSSEGYVVNNYGFVTQLEHRLLRATVRGGLEFNYTEYDEVDTTGGLNRDNEENYSLFLSYSRGFLNERLSFDSTVRYSFNNGAVDWNQWLVSASLSMPF